MPQYTVKGVSHKYNGLQDLSFLGINLISMLKASDLNNDAKRINALIIALYRVSPANSDSVLRDRLNCREYNIAQLTNDKTPIELASMADVTRSRMDQITSKMLRKIARSFVVECEACHMLTKGIAILIELSNGDGEVINAHIKKQKEQLNK